MRGWIEASSSEPLSGSRRPQLWPSAARWHSAVSADRLREWIRGTVFTSSVKSHELTDTEEQCQQHAPLLPFDLPSSSHRIPTRRSSYPVDPSHAPASLSNSPACSQRQLLVSVGPSYHPGEQRRQICASPCWKRQFSRSLPTGSCS
jgi:hypothetical protein